MAVRSDDVDLVRDRSLVELCQAGDHRAFGDLYTRYYARLLRFCARRVGNPHEAEEITQEAFSRAFSAMPRFAGERRFYPWLTVIAGRLCIDSHRRLARTEPAAEIDLGGVDGGQQQIIDNVDLAYLGQAMQQLGPRHREVLDLRETQGWTYQQIADHYDVTMGTVEALLFRARKALRREFLAIAGDEPRFIAIPFVGAALRALQKARSRFQHLQSEALPFAAAGAATIAAMASGIASPPSTAVAAPAPRVAAAMQTASPVALVLRPVLPVAHGGPVTAAQPAIGPAPTPAAPAGVRITNASDAHNRAHDDSSALVLAGVTISTDLVDTTSLLKDHN